MKAIELIRLFGLCVILTVVAGQSPRVSAAPGPSESCPGGTYCFSYGFIEANVTVNRPERKRVKVTSDVFSYCSWDQSTDAIARDAKNRVRQDVASKYGSSIEITYIFVNGAADTQADAERNRKRAMAAPFYSDHMQTAYQFAAYSSKCHR